MRNLYCPATIGLLLSTGLGTGCAVTDPSDAGAGAGDQTAPLPSQDDPAVSTAVQAEGGSGPGCELTGIVDRGWSGGLHYWEIYGDFRCGHSQSFPSLITSQDWVGFSCYSFRSVTVTYTSSFQVNVAMGPTNVGWCMLELSSWNNHVAQIQFGM